MRLIKYPPTLLMTQHNQATRMRNSVMIKLKTVFMASLSLLHCYHLQFSRHLSFVSAAIFPHISKWSNKPRMKNNLNSFLLCTRELSAACHILYRFDESSQ